MDFDKSIQYYFEILCLSVSLSLSLSLSHTHTLSLLLYCDLCKNQQRLEQISEYKLISHGLSFPLPPQGLILPHILTPVTLPAQFFS